MSRRYRGIVPAAVKDPIVREFFEIIDQWILDADGGPSQDVITLIQSTAGISDHGLLTGLADDDHLQYALLAGRSGGQTLNGDTSSGTGGLTLFGASSYTTQTLKMNPAGSTATLCRIEDTASFTFPGGSTLVLDVVGHHTGGVGAAGTFFKVRNGTTIDVLTASAGGTDASVNMCGGKVVASTNTFSPLDTFTITGHIATSSALRLNGAAGQTDNMTEWRTSGGTLLSRIKSDGTFDGPISTTGVTSFQDSTFSLFDNVDNTKLLAFQLSGITAGTTRTLTVPNASGLIALDPTTTNGDTIYSNGTALVRLPIGGTGNYLRVTGGIPTWTAIPGSDLTAGSVTKTQMQNRTRSVFLPAALFEAAAKTLGGVAPDIYQKISNGAVSPSYQTTTLVIPSDYDSGPNLDIYYSAAGTSTNSVVWNIYALNLTVGTSAAAAFSATDNIVASPDGTADHVNMASGATAITGVAGAGNLVRLVVSRDPTDASDTNGDTMMFMGAMFTYTADS